MVKLMKDPHTGDIVVQTTCLDAGSFIGELAEAMSAVKKKDDELVTLGILQSAMPIAFKLSGYKADEVQEQRLLWCGKISPAGCEDIAVAGK